MPHTLTLMLTSACNLACDYCYVRKAEGYMSPSMAVAAFREFGDSSAGITLFGGEPLLDFGGLVAICEALNGDAQSRGLQPPSFALTTNGTLVNEDIADWCSRNIARVLVSIDGTLDAHDAHRAYSDGSGSHRDSMRGLRMLAEAGATLEVNQVLNPDTLAQLVEGTETVVDAGAGTIHHTLNVSAAWTANPISQLQAEVSRLGSWYESTFRGQRGIELSAFDGPIRAHVNAATADMCRCCGRDSAVVDSRGTVAPCDVFAGLGISSVGRIGEAGLSMDHAWSAIGEGQPQQCASCEIAQRCLRDCACMNQLGTGSPTQVPPVWCEFMTAAVCTADGLANRLFADNNKAFLERFYGRGGQ